MAAMSAAGFEKAQIKDAVAATTFTAAETAATVHLLNHHILASVLQLSCEIY